MSLGWTSIVHTSVERYYSSCSTIVTLYIVCRHERVTLRIYSNKNMTLYYPTGSRSFLCSCTLAIGRFPGFIFVCVCEQNEGIRVVTFDDIADATAAHKALATELAANLGRRVRVHFVIPAPYRVRP